MADGTAQNGTAIVAGDEITTDNGVTVTARQAQRIKIDSVGADGAFRDASRAYPFPVALVSEADATFRGRSQTFRIPGLAGTAGQKLFALHNATGSTKIAHINQLTVDLMQTVVKAITVAPPVIRVHRFTAIPTGGTAGAKTAKDTALTSNASVTAWQGASADGTGTTLNVTIPASSILTQEFAPRVLQATAAAITYEPFDRTTLLEGADIVLRALEGVVVELVYVAATQNPITDMWVVGCDWYEV